jgi:hypothetical protein
MLFYPRFFFSQQAPLPSPWFELQTIFASAFKFPQLLVTVLWILISILEKSISTFIFIFTQLCRNNSSVSMTTRSFDSKDMYVLRLFPLRPGVNGSAEYLEVRLPLSQTLRCQQQNILTNIRIHHHLQCTVSRSARTDKSARASVPLIGVLHSGVYDLAL